LPFDITYRSLLPLLPPSRLVTGHQLNITIVTPRQPPPRQPATILPLNFLRSPEIARQLALARQSPFINNILITFYAGTMSSSLLRYFHWPASLVIVRRALFAMLNSGHHVNNRLSRQKPLIIVSNTFVSSILKHIAISQ